MNCSLGNMLGRRMAINPDGLSLDLQFADDKTLTARRGPTPVFTRASTATFVGSNGIIQSAAINEARFDHDSANLASKGLLIEESRTNLCLQSNAFSTSPWGNINTACAVSQNQTGPDGVTNSAWTFTDDSAINSEGRYLTASLTSGVAYSFSIFVKKTTGTPTTYPAIWLARSGTFGGCVINTTAGTATPITALGVGTIISTTASVVDFGNFWRVTSFITPTVTGSWEISVSPSGNGSGTGVMDGTTTGSAVFWGAQLEAGAFATSYIPTTTAALTRSADVCTITGGDFTGFYNQSEGTMLANAFTPASGDRTVLSADDNTANEMIRIRTEGTNPLFKVTDGGSEVVAIDAGTVVANTAFKLAGAYKLNDFASSINGGAAVTDTSGTIPTVDRMRIGVGQGGNTMCGCISAIRYFKKRVADAKLQALTT